MEDYKPNWWWESKLKEPIMNISQAAATLNPFVTTSKRSKDWLRGFQAAWAELERQKAVIERISK